MPVQYIRWRLQTGESLSMKRSDSLEKLIWYGRMGFIPLIRGFLMCMSLAKCALPFFLGKKTKITYRSQISLGKMVFIGDYFRINACSTEGIKIGNRVTLREFGIIQCSSSPLNKGVGIEIGDHVYIGPRCNLGIGGKLRIGSKTLIGADFTAISENHIFDEHSISTKEVSRKGINVGEHCWIGHRVTILDGVSIGDNTIIGAGSVVTKSFPAGSRIAGVPAKCL